MKDQATRAGVPTSRTLEQLPGKPTNVESFPGRGTTQTVVGIMVTYHPEISEVRECLRSALETLGCIVLVDNSTSPDSRRAVTALAAEAAAWVGSASPREASPRVVFIPVGRNVGLAAAYNIGVCAAREKDATHILLLDQDTHLQHDTVASLGRIFQDLALHERVGVVSATNIDSLQSSFARIWQLFESVRQRSISDHPTPYSYGVVETPVFINSGTLLSSDALRQVGGFNEELFIEAVDFDMALRLRSRGFRIFRAATAFVDHRLGSEIRLNLARWTLLSRANYTPERSRHAVIDNCRFAARWFREFPRVVIVSLLITTLTTLGELMLLPGRRHRLRRMLSPSAQSSESVQNEVRGLAR